MLRRTTLAAATILLAGPALLAGPSLLAGSALADDTCLPDATGEQCDLFLGQYRADETPVGTTDVWSTKPFVMENFRYLDSRRPLESPRGDDVLYWDGESAMVVPEESGPQVKIADW